MRGKARLLAALAAFALVLGPALAEARPGGGRSSFGSRGSRTFSPPPVTRTAPDTARPMDRTFQQPTRPGSTVPGAASTLPGRSGRFGGGFGGALLGGLIGMGLGGLLFGHGLFGGFSGFGSFLGLLLQIGLIVLLVRFAMNFFRSRQHAMAGGPRPQGGPQDRPQDRPQGRPQGLHRMAQPMGSQPMAGGAASAPVAVGDSDFRAFESLLREVNAAWSRRDEAGLARLVTPEMMNFFAQDLRDLAARGWRNETRDVRLEQGDLAEAWREGGTEYATVAMRFSLIDVTHDAQGRVVEGDAQRRDTTTEIWTFRRNAPGEAWKLSALQQTG
ncbi:Tim44 domain-containing protein [Roseomonas sp. M0104]|uniref:Tim44 domain-containing protein n=1 Tax=Teichococcus coralli TaxID=2545983 RepID=A0A845BDJ1_9PROT|nr:TIM44-like domain-containing protein [Pseudoroseomonas coralli]MXP65653.1 Tim44 domain-containing protein [Pseudoroseomonas coralli]